MARRQQAASVETTVEAPAQIQIPTIPGYVTSADQSVKNDILDGATLVIGLDVGYGLVKALAWGFDPVKFRTVYGHERDLGYQKIEIMQKHPGESISTDDGDFFVGDLAAQHLPVAEQFTLAGRDDANDIRRLMMLVVLGKMFPDLYRDEPIRVRVVTGLPVKHMRGANQLKLALMSKRELVHTDHCKFPVEIEAVSVMPQPKATLTAFSMNPDGSENPYWTFHKAAVIDNGHLTVDIATELDGDFVEAESGTVETGMSTAYKRLTDLYNDAFGEFPSQRMIEKILTGGGKFKIGRDEQQDWSTEVEEVLRPMRAATINLCRETLGKATEHEFIANIGGPAPAVHSLIAREYKGTIMPQFAQTTNALGYLHYGGFIASVDS